MEGKLRQRIDTALVQKYGNAPDKQIVKRVEEEWVAMERSGVLPDAAALYELTAWLRQEGHPYWLRAGCGSSFIFYLLGITTGNPLPPHYYCPNCKAVHWQPFCADGFDLPRNKICEYDDIPMTGDGHDIPWQTLFGYGDFCAVFDIDLPADLYDLVLGVWGERWLGRLTSGGECRRLFAGEHRCIKCSNLSLIFSLKRDKLYSGFHAREVTWEDREGVLSHWECFVDHDTGFADEVSQPECVADLIALFGLSRSLGAWDEVTAFMLREMGYAPSDLIAYRDDVYRYLRAHQFLEKDAWRGMNHVRKGLALPVITREMKQARDKWVLSRCEKVEYLFPKAHAVEYIFFVLKSLE